MSEIIVIQESIETVEVSTPGVPGPAGVGVPAGGTTGQRLVKNSDTDYDTEWATASAGETPALTDLTDVTGGAPNTGEAPVWDGDSFELTDVLTAAEAASGYQPLDSDLTSISALTTTAFGRGLLELANQAALLSAAGAAAASHAHAGEDITSGTVADARIASTIARDSEVTSAVAALSTVYQPLDSDLTSISALTTTSFGRAFLTLADEAAFKAAVNLEAGTDFPSLTTFNDHSARHEDGGGDEISIAGLSGTSAALQTHLDDTSDAHDASSISILDTANDFTATDVEGALAELQSDAEADATAFYDHISDTADAHDASAISFTPAGTIAATDVQAAIEEVAAEASSGGSGEAMEREISQTAHGLSVGNIVRHNGTSFVKAQADTADHAEVVGIVSEVADVDTFTLHYGGRITGLSSLTAGVVYYLDDDTAGLLTATEPTDSGDISKPVLIADSTTSGYFFNLRGMSGGSSGGGGGAVGQAHVMILGWPEPGAQTNFDNRTGGGFAEVISSRYSDDTDGATISWPVVLLEGTYALSLGTVIYSGSGILRFALDDGGGFVDIDDAPYGASSATVDTYGGSSVNQTLEVCTDLDIPAAGVYTIRATVDGKNGSSSGYATNITYVALNARTLA